MASSSMDFILAHITNCNFAHLKIEESFGFIWVKSQNG